ncbi:recombinase family protein [Mycoplasmatota bacterium WC44]
MTIYKEAARYSRYSSDNQRYESIEAQERAIGDFAEKEGYTIVRSYVDKATSGTSTVGRDGFLQMIEDSAKGGFQYVIVHKLDRFARDRYDSAVYKRKLKDNGVKVISVLENLDDNPESIILESVLEGMNEYYSANLSREVKKGQAENALKAVHNGGIPPLGLDVDPATKKYIINEHEAVAVRIIYKMFSSSYSYEQIAERLVELGYNTKRGTDIKSSSLIDILRNEKYIGNYVFNRTVSKNHRGKRNNRLSKNDDDIIRVKGAIEPIISEKLFNEVQEILNNRRNGGKFKAKTNYLLSGLIYCKKCGGRLQGNKRKAGSGKKEYASYRCRCKEVKEINKENLDGYVANLLMETILDEKNIN